MIELGYGRAKIPFVYDEGRFRLLAPEETDARPLSDVEIIEAIDAPINSPPLDEIIEPGETVLIVVSDATRATASAQIVNLLVRRLIQSGVVPRDIHVIFATGIHRAVAPDEKRELLTPFVAQRIRILDTDANDRAQMISLGETERGTPIEINRALKEHDHVILTGGIAFHYFAGFTGGRKSVCPGLASARTVRATHMLALDFETGGRRAGVGTGLLEGNAVHEECERIAAEASPSFLINAIVDEQGRCVRLFAGDWRAAHRRACESYSQDHSVKIEEKREVVVASCGGAPYDINLIQAHKTLDMAAHACKEGGTIILLAECADGFGRADFPKWFDERDSRALAERLRTDYEVNGQTAWSLLTKTEAFRVHLVSELDDEVVKRMRMTPARSVYEVMAKQNAQARGYIMARGASVLPIVG